MISAIISRLVILVFGTLYPAYASYKAVRAKNLKEYVKWMMYWIVFALFTCAETFTDVFLSWFPFYYEVKIVLVMWLLSPATSGSSILYRKFVHPALCRREQEIDEYISRAKEQGYHTVLNLGTKGVNYATTVIMQTAIKGGGGLVQQLKKSYSLVDLSDSDPRSRSEQELLDEVDDVITDPRLIRRSVARRGYSPRRSASESNNRMYFSDVDISRGSSTAGRNIINDFSHIKSSEDISSGYSSADNSATRDATLTRTASVGATTRTRTRQMATRSTFTSIKRPSAAEESEVIIEELDDDDVEDDDVIFPVDIFPQYAMSPSFHVSQTNPPFIFEIVGNKINLIKILGSTGLETSNLEIKADVDKNTVGDVNDSSLEANLSDDVKVKANEGISSQDNQNNLLRNEDNVESNTAELTNSNGSEVSTEDIKIKNTFEYNVSANNTVTLSDVVKSTASRNIEMPNVTNFNVTNSNSSVSLHSTKSALRQWNYDGGDTTSLDTSVANMSTGDSDDNKSFATPESSPVMRKKKLKHIKRKAPSPPSASQAVYNLDSSVKGLKLRQVDDNFDKTSFPKISKSSITHKNKSSKSERNKYDSPISKLLQLPGKLAFWQKTASTSGSENNSRRTSLDNSHVLESRRDPKCSSSIDLNPEDTFNVVTNTNPTAKCSDDLPENKDNYEASILSKDAKNILEKGTILQKLIEAKLDSHPEYKIISLHDNLDLLLGNKSTEV